jgi:ABC-type nickel/cobalt efflux system permease component RcnA
MAGEREHVLGRMWRRWTRPKVISHPVVAAVYIGVLWGVSFGLFQIVTGHETAVLATIVSSVLVGVLFFGPLMAWHGRRMERQARSYYADRPIPFSGGKRT